MLTLEEVEKLTRTIIQTAGISIAITDTNTVAREMVVATLRALAPMVTLDPPPEKPSEKPSEKPPTTPILDQGGKKGKE